VQFLHLLVVPLADTLLVVAQHRHPGAYTRPLLGST
jgi:hypothetical protein